MPFCLRLCMKLIKRDLHIAVPMIAYKYCHLRLENDLWIISYLHECIANVMVNCCIASRIPLLTAELCCRIVVQWLDCVKLGTTSLVLCASHRL